MLGGILVRYVCLVEYWYGMYAWWNTGTVCMLGGILVRYVCFGGFFFFQAPTCLPDVHSTTCNIELIIHNNVFCIIRFFCCSGGGVMGAPGHNAASIVLSKLKTGR